MSLIVLAIYTDVLLTRGDPNTDAFKCEICDFVMPVGYASSGNFPMYREYDADKHITMLTNMPDNSKKREHTSKSKKP